MIQLYLPRCVIRLEAAIHRIPNSYAFYQAGKFNRVPVMIGTNRDEGSLFTSQFYDYTPEQMVLCDVLLASFLCTPFLTMPSGLFLGSLVWP
jgi:aminopeptidase-like protein